MGRSPGGRRDTSTFMNRLIASWPETLGTEAYWDGYLSSKT